MGSVPRPAGSRWLLALLVVASQQAAVAQSSPPDASAPSSAAPRARPPTTWVVDDDGPANFADLPPAIAAASDGDVLVLRPGRYSAATLVGKGLSLVGAGAASTTIEQRGARGPFFAASDLAKEQTLVLANLTGVGRGSSLELSRIHGIVIATDLVVDGREGAIGPQLDQCLQAYLSRVAVLPAPDGGGGHGVALANGRYSLTQVVAVGATGAPGRSPRGRGKPGGHGVAATDCDLDLALSDLMGGDGGPALWELLAPFCAEAPFAGGGGAALGLAGNVRLRVAGDGRQQMRGGQGGAGTSNPWERCWSWAGDGGAALWFEPGATRETIAFGGVALFGGNGGAGEATRVGHAAAPIEPADVVVGAIEEPWPTLAIEPVPAAGAPARLRVFGHPGDTVVVRVGRELGSVKLKRYHGFYCHVLGENLWQPEYAGRIGEDGQIALETRLPAEATVVGQWFAAQAFVTRGRGDEAITWVTNVDVVAIGDGGGGVADARRQ